MNIEMKKDIFLVNTLLPTLASIYRKSKSAEDTQKENIQKFLSAILTELLKDPTEEQFINAIKASEEFPVMLEDNNSNYYVCDEDFFRGIYEEYKEKENAIKLTNILLEKNIQRLDESEARSISIFLDYVNDNSKGTIVQKLQSTPEMLYLYYKVEGTINISKEEEKEKEAPELVQYDKIFRLTFLKADAIALAFGVKPMASVRLMAGLIYELQRKNGTGHTTVYELIKGTAKSLNLGDDTYSSLVEAINTLIEKEVFIIEEYNQEYFVSFKIFHDQRKELRKELSENILKKIRTNSNNNYMSLEEIDESLKDWQNENNIILSEEQKKAIFAAYNTPITFINGIHNTGKTTIALALLALIDKQGGTAKLCTTTGQSAIFLNHEFSDQISQLNDSKNKDISTIQLAVKRKIPFVDKRSISSIIKSPLKNKKPPVEIDIYIELGDYKKCSYKCSYNEKNELCKLDYLIIDEAMFLDLTTCYYVFKSISKSSTKCIFLGDTHLLPPVNTENAFLYYLGFNEIKTIELKQVYAKTEQEKNINKLTSYILGKEEADISKIPQDVFKQHYIEGSNELISYSIKKDIANFYIDFIIKNDHIIKNDRSLVQVLTANKDVSFHINAEIQDLYQEKVVKKKYGRRANYITVQDTVAHLEKKFYEQDYIIQTQNRHIPISNEIDVYNGERGIVTNIIYQKPSEPKGIKVALTERDNSYNYYLNKNPYIKWNIDLAYSVTIHRSIGRKFDTVIICLSKDRIISNLNAYLYTAITRAKKQIILFSENGILEKVRKINKELNMIDRPTASLKNTIEENSSNIVPSGVFMETLHTNFLRPLSEEEQKELIDKEF